MKTYLKYTIIALAALLAISLVVCGGLTLPAQAAGTTYYVDCSASTNGDGTSGSPWNNLTSVNNTTFAAGDFILFKRGTTCSGTLWPKGSGVDGSPITISAYGTGNQPVIDANGTGGEIIKLYNQSYWHIEDLEAVNGTYHGIYIGGTNGATLDHFRLTNLVVHGVTGVLDTSKSSGLVVLSNWNQTVTDVVIDGVTAYDTNMWNGIAVLAPSGNYSSDVTVRNCTVHDIGGDGLVVHRTDSGLVEHSTVYVSGLVDTTAYGTPNGMWPWSSSNVVFQFNEAYQNGSPGVDGGAFDIDYPSEDITYQYNYAHDNEGYCISIFGASGDTTMGSIVRYNICSNNGVDPARAGQGDIKFATWDNGYVDGVAVYNNTHYWNPVVPACLVNIGNTAFTGSQPKFIMNNIFYSADPCLISANSTAVSFDYNVYWHTGGAPEWRWGGSIYTSLAAFQSATGQDTHSVYADPLLNGGAYHDVGMPTWQFTLLEGSPALDSGADLVTLGLVSDVGSQDFYGNAIPQGSDFEIGAYEGGPMPTPTYDPNATDTPTPLPTATPIPPESNLLQNPGFEDGLAYWDFNVEGLTAIVTDLVHSGAQALKVGARNRLGGRQQNVTAVVQPGTPYILGVWALVDGGAGYVGFKGEDAGGTPFEQVITIDHTGGYLYKQLEVNTPASISWASVYCWSPRGVTMWCDDVMLAPKYSGPTPTPAPTDTPITPTDTPVPPTNTPGGPTETPAPPTDTPLPTNTPGSGGNLALNQPVTASSVRYPVANAVDGDPVTYWCPIKSKVNKPRPNDEWIRVDLGATYEVQQVVLKWAHPDRYATAYSIDVSLNDSDWTSVYSTSSGAGGTATIGFAATDARYVRLYSTAWYVEWEGDYLGEFEVYE